MHEQPGWLYVGDGWLRYRDVDGWTDRYLPAELVRGSEWPPPAPARSQGLVVGGTNGTAGVATPVSPTSSVRASRLRGLLGAGRQIGRHRSRA